jgi:hypothetical protein
MPIIRSLRRASLPAALLFVLAPAAARDLGSFDINAPTGAKAAAAPPGARSDAIGRATFSWIGQELPAASKSTATDAESVARAHVRTLLGNAKQAGDSSAILSDAIVEEQAGGASLVRFTPRLEGIEIFHEGVALLMDRSDRLVAMRGPLPRESAAQAKSLPAFRLDARDAIAIALGGHDFERDVADRLQPESRKDSEYQWFRLPAAAKSASGATGDGPQRARRVWFRTRAGLQPAWYVETQVADSPTAAGDLHAFVISAIDGRELFRLNLTAHATAYTYSVWSESGPAFLPLPGPAGRATTPDPDGTPSNNTAPFVNPELRTLTSLPFTRSATDPWLPDGATTTHGNNVRAYADLAAPSGFGAGDLQPAPNGSTFGEGYVLALASNASATQTNASTTQLFFWVNWLHDTFYDHGFKEVDGNAQANNFGRGGAGGDEIVAEAQDYDVEDNANMATPADGNKPRMQMGINTSATPVTDNTIDGRTIAHEWAHYLSNRLVGNGSGLSTEHARGLGEGWSDFVAQLVLVKEEDRQKPGNGSYEGTYGSGYADHSYYGFRRYPLSTELAKNPLTLRHIVDGVALPVPPPPRFGQSGANNSEVHNQGEIWAAALWEGYAAMLRDGSRLSFSQAQSRMMDYVVGGMKLTPVAPTMLEARDAILATVLANGATEDFNLLVAAFAKRGLGAGAFVPDRYSNSMIGTLESSSSGAGARAAELFLGAPSGCDADTVLDNGERATLSIQLANGGFTALTGVTATVSASDPAVTFPNGNSISVGALALFESKTVSLPIAITGNIATGSRVAFTVTPAAANPSLAAVIATTTINVNFDEASRSSSTDEFDGTGKQWRYYREPVGDGVGTWAIREQGAARFLHGSDENLEAVTWAETPVMSVGAGVASVSLRHRYWFEAEDDNTVFYDGGLVQASLDGGATWTDVTLPAGAVPLSNCCGNPAAGKLAFVAKSVGYPEFFDSTFQLGAAFANQSNVKLRFGVATDQSVTRGGWDVDRITVNGLNDTPFSTVVAQSGSCAAASNKSLQGAMSGTYYSPERSGEGVLVDFGQVGGTPVVFFSWYTYDGGAQRWLVGSAPFSTSSTSVTLDLIETGGARFGSQFRPEDVVDTSWGSAALSFPSCDTLQLTYQRRAGDSGTLTMQRGLSRLEAAQCNVLHGGLSGTYYSTQRSGEGVLVDFGKAGNDPVEFFTWYTYENGEQQWLVGSKRFAPTDSNVSVDLIRTSGAQFGQGFRSQDVVDSPWGKVTQRFVNCDRMELSYEKTGGETGTLVLERGLQRLGDGVCH